MLSHAVLARSLGKVVYRWFERWRIYGVILLAATVLSGCVNYQAGVTFETPNRGELVQHIQLKEQLTAFSSSQAQEWLESLEQRARKLDGKVKRLSKQEVVLRIPFASGNEFEEKFNQFFNPPKPKKGNESLDIPPISSKLQLQQGNFIFWVRNHLVYEVDLRSLALVANDGNVIVSPASLFDLEFTLNTPGAKAILRENQLAPSSDARKTIVWTLIPGQVNHLEAVFWLPSPLGIGTVFIVLLVLAGYYLKYQQIPGFAGKKPTPEAS